LGRAQNGKGVNSDYMNKVHRIKCGNGNCYLVSKGNNTILVDTSRTKYKDEILELCRTKDVKLILLTHGHVDHIQNAAYLSKELNAPIAMHKADYALIKDNMTEPMFAHGMLPSIDNNAVNQQKAVAEACCTLSMEGREASISPVDEEFQRRQNPAF